MSWPAFEQAAGSGNAAAAAELLGNIYTAGGRNAFGTCRQALLSYLKQQENAPIELMWAMVAHVWNDPASPTAYLLLMTLEEVGKAMSVVPALTVRSRFREKVLAVMEQDVGTSKVVDAKVVVKTIVLCRLNDIDQTMVVRYARGLVQDKDMLVALVQLVHAFPNSAWPVDEYLVQITAFNSWPMAERLIASLSTNDPNVVVNAQHTLITLAVQKGDLKRAHKWVHQYSMQTAFPEVENILQQEALDKLCGQQKWSIAVKFVGANTILQMRLFHALVAAGQVGLANHVHDRFSLTSVPKATTMPSARSSDEDTEGSAGQPLALPQDVAIVLCDTVNAMESFERAVLECLACQDNECWLGVDVEWKPVFSKTDQPLASVLQLAVGHQVFIVDLIALEEASAAFEMLDRVLQHPDVIKVGFGFSHDLQVLRQTFPDKGRCFHYVSSFIELTQILHNLYPTTHLGRAGLSSATQFVLGACLDKEQQLSDWTARPLSTAQLRYAATDAWCLLRILSQLRSCHPAMDLNKQDLHHCEPNEASHNGMSARVVERRHDHFTRHEAKEDVVVRFMARQCADVLAECRLQPLEYQVPPNAIVANTLCLFTNDIEPHVVVLPQSEKVDLAVFAIANGCPRRRVRLATAQECVQRFGFVPGSVPPIAHADSSTTIWMDQSVMSSPAPVVTGGGLHHVLECNNGAGLHALCGGDARVKVEKLCKRHLDNKTLQTPTDTLRFLSDAHLGRVTKWLRMRGVDIALFDDQGRDRTKFIDQAAAEKRIMLTTDRKLGQRRIAVVCFVVSSDDPRQQFHEVLTHFGLSAAGTVVPRCSRCNGDGFRMLTSEEVQEAAMRQTIAQETLNTVSEFWQCLACKKIFWTAWKRFQTMRFQDALDSTTVCDQPSAAAIDEA
ncbi:hypothetical protein, variant 1 [Aphanomyces invadans]|uniref:3'-5' exonuclease domain-containing protein n=1 Tax=Aphanomyces invadans TaxID=157072 RepID=A0A024TKW0_9STRA|nr:hypothetical protein, variant 1 [Aphanomyces invadans]ETV94644.1 hypothetical protein, variant 1 [Aphanomyces invadans]|eukprot:XP_008876588.1 hypothetical protein, variant 1 [Aphanomyces invadans]